MSNRWRLFLGAWAALWLGLICLSHTQAQFNGCQSGFCSKIVAAGFTPSCTESTNWLARATSVVSTTDKQNYDNLICGLVADTDFAHLDWLHIYSSVDRTTALLNLIQNAYNGTEIGTVNFTAFQGYTGDGSTFAINTGFNPVSASSPKYVLDSASLGVYVRSNITSGGSNAVNIGADNVGAANLQAFVFGATQYKLNGPNRSPSSSTSQGLWISTRTASNAVALYRNGNTTAVDTGTDTSDFVPFSPLYTFAQNNGGVNSPTVAQMSAALGGSGVTSAQMARIAGRINTYMTAYSINVYYQPEDDNWAWLVGAANDNNSVSWRQAM